MSGINTIPLPFFLSKAEIINVLYQVNGLVLIGGGVPLITSKGQKTAFMKKLDFIISVAKQLNDRGTPFPIWASCLGYESLLIHDIGIKAVNMARIAVNDENKRQKLVWDYKQLQRSVFFKHLPKEDFKTLEDQELMIFAHRWAFLPTYIKKSSYRVIASSTDINNRNFVSFVENKHYPFFGSQFHPEKIAFEHKKRVNSNINLYSIKVVQDMSRFILALALKNNNHFENVKYLEGMLFKNFESQKVQGIFETIFLFSKEDFLKSKILSRSDDKIIPK